MSINESRGRRRLSARATPRSDLLRSLALLLATVLLIALALETVVRAHRGRLLALDPARKRSLRLTERPIAVHDPRLGHLPKPDLTGDPWPSGVRVTTDAESIRSNGGPRPAGTPIVAVGDSFTFGTDVEDDETWPARLEALVGRPVLNAGVFGYGLDQIALRAEQLLDAHRDADTLIVAAFGNDIERCEYSYLFAPKPYFAVVDGGLALRNSPAPDANPPVPFAGLRSVLAYSDFADWLLSEALPSWWLVEGGRRHEHDQGLEVSTLLLDRLAAAAAQRGVRLLFVALLPSLDPTPPAPLGALVAHARSRGIEVIDLTAPLVERVHEDKQFWLTRSGHFSPSANAWVAERIAAVLR